MDRKSTEYMKRIVSNEIIVSMASLKKKKKNERKNRESFSVVWRLLLKQRAPSYRDLSTLIDVTPIIRILETILVNEQVARTLT